MGVAEGGFPYSHFTLSQNVNILVKTKNAPKALKHKININFFCDMGISRGEGGLAKWEFFPHFSVFGCESIPKGKVHKKTEKINKC